MESEKNIQKKKLILLFVIIIVLLLGVITALVFVLLKPKDKDIEEHLASSGTIAYEANIVVDDEDALQDAVNELFEKAKEGQMALEMQTEAHSTDGKTFSCFLGNAKENNYDMFMVFYLDETQEEIYRTGLIPIGARIEQFTLKEQLKPGSYEITIVYNQVEEDQETIHAQVNVGLTLVVK